jgi:hypothetical protein
LRCFWQSCKQDRFHKTVHFACSLQLLWYYRTASNQTWPRPGLETSADMSYSGKLRCQALSPLLHYQGVKTSRNPLSCSRNQMHNQSCWSQIEAGTDFCKASLSKYLDKARFQLSIPNKNNRLSSLNDQSTLSSAQGHRTDSNLSYKAATCTDPAYRSHDPG